MIQVHVLVRVDVWLQGMVLSGTLGEYDERRYSGEKNEHHIVILEGYMAANK